jgi:hypothetical protein
VQADEAVLGEAPGDVTEVLGGSGVLVLHQHRGIAPRGARPRQVTH